MRAKYALSPVACVSRQVDAAVAALEARNPVANAVGALAGRWELLYTTERDVHLFCRCGRGEYAVPARGARPWQTLCVRACLLTPCCPRCSLPGGASSVSQEVDATRTRVTNRIAWRLLGLQLAAGAPATTSAPKRLSYRFAELRLTAAGLPLLTLQLGPEGPGGWSDCTYIDDDTRIARNSRGDLLVLQRSS